MRRRAGDDFDMSGILQLAECPDDVLIINCGKLKEDMTKNVAPMIGKGEHRRIAAGAKFSGVRRRVPDIRFKPVRKLLLKRVIRQLFTKNRRQSNRDFRRNPLRYQFV